MTAGLKKSDSSLRADTQEKLTLVKIGGNVVDDEKSLAVFLSEFSKISGYKILVHGGGKIATELAVKLNLPQTLVEGRRVTDPETLKIITMVYGGLVNKTLVARLEALGVSSVGLTGADFNLIRSKKREVNEVNFGLVGDIESVNTSKLTQLLKEGHVPVLAPLTHDGKGQILNTNADTIANEVATRLSKNFGVSLIYTFEKEGVLLNVEDEKSRIPSLNFEQFEKLKSEGKIFAGMIPKLTNAFQALKFGVNWVTLGKAEKLLELVSGKNGTRLTYD